MKNIRFPKMHIASSVTNRLLNLADELEADGIASGSLVRASAPPIADTTMQSARLDAALSTPPAPAVPPIDHAPDPGQSLAGKPLLATMLDPET